MRTHLLVASALALSSTAVAQEIEIYPGVTSFTSRGNTDGNATGEILQGLHTTAFTGIGDEGSGTRGTVTGFGVLIQDQDASTQENFYIVFRTGTDANGPDPSASGLRSRIGPITVPPGPAQPAAFNVTTAVASEKNLDLCGMNAFGVELPPNPQWTADGLSAHMSRGDGAFGQSVQCAAAGRPNMAWGVNAGVVSQPSLERSWRFRVSTSAPTLQIGNGSNKYGQGGLYPDVNVPLSARARYGSAMAGGSSLLYLSVVKICPGASIIPGSARLYMDPHGPFVVPIDATGEAIYNFGNTPAISPGISLHFQCGGFSGGTAALTNLATSDI